MAGLHWLQKLSWRTILAAASALAMSWVVQLWMVREAGILAVHQRELSVARRLLAQSRQSWLPGNSAVLLGARAAMLDGDREEAERLLKEASWLSGDAFEFEKVLLRFRAGDTGDAVAWLSGSQNGLDEPAMTQVLEALIDGALRASDHALASQCLELWQGQTGVAVGAVAAGPVWQQSKLESWQGDLAWSQALPDVAIQHFRRAIELQGGNEIARLKLAELLLQYGAEEALSELQFLRSRKPTNRDVLLRLAACYRELGELERAAEVLDELLKYRPDDMSVLLERGRLALDAGQLADAERWLRDAERRVPSHREVLLALARCLQLAGKTVDAENYRRMVNSLDAGGLPGMGAGGTAAGGAL